MRIYFNKKDNEIIMIGKQGELPSITFVEDRGTNQKQRVNIFGQPLSRYRFHCSSINEGYSTAVDKLDFINVKDRVYLKKRGVRK